MSGRTESFTIEFIDQHYLVNDCGGIRSSLFQRFSDLDANNCRYVCIRISSRRYNSNSIQITVVFRSRHAFSYSDYCQLEYGKSQSNQSGGGYNLAFASDDMTDANKNNLVIWKSVCSTSGLAVVILTLSTREKLYIGILEEDILWCFIKFTSSNVFVLSGLFVSLHTAIAFHQSTFSSINICIVSQATLLLTDGEIAPIGFEVSKYCAVDKLSDGIVLSL